MEGKGREGGFSVSILIWCAVWLSLFDDDDDIVFISIV